MVTHGTSDYTVAIVNGQQVITQYATTLDLILGNGVAKGYITNTPTTTQSGSVPGGRTYTTYGYNDTLDGNQLMQFIKIDSMGHAWPGGSNQGSYTDPTAPDASELMVLFFRSSVKPTTTGTTGTTTGTGTTGTGTTGSSTSSSTSNSTGTTGAGTTGAGTTGTTGTTGSTSSSTTGSTSSGPSQVTLYSLAGQTGWAGQLLTDGSSSSNCQVGTKGMFNVDTYRGILTFDTSSLDPSKTIASASLQITRASLTGSISNIIVSFKNSEFGATITQSQYNAPVTIDNVGSLAVPSSDNGSSSIVLPSAVIGYLQGSSTVAFRLKSESPATFVSNLLELIMPGSSDAPSLVVQYA
eukprot:TRINITY_DN1038_c0_g1_i4.p1 TRINITY_DN1038_c0_g1~~TRINITY_DN1038_c0_g1_i4.p1  ORF type:complete len:353 (-),score=30.64 TRINITY_DN1038_c0_g1_i4:33-1091(-)